MAQYFFYAEINKWVKQCSRCFEVTTGTSDEAESFVIFQTMFARGETTDGLTNRCWMCGGRRSQIGATRQIVEQLFKKQNGKCGICSEDITLLRGASNIAHVDHDKKTGVIRELLCGQCNTGIGLFYHDPAKLRAAAVYCERHDKVVQLRCVSDAG